jgi:hypothetical protein
MTDLPGVGRIAEKDDIAPEGTVITRQHVIDYQNRCNAAAARLGLPPSFPNVPKN